MHECIIAFEQVPDAAPGFFVVACHCHEDWARTWKLGDAPLTCPVSGDSLTDKIGVSA